MRRNASPAKFICLVCLAAALGSAQLMEAATYYVRTSGSDSKSGKSAGNAFRTIQKAASVAIAGDTIWVGSGTYGDVVSFTNHGQSSSPIRVNADLDGSLTGDAGTVTVSRSNTAFDIRKNYIEVNGLQFGGTASPGTSGGDENTSVGNAGVVRCTNCVGIAFNNCVFFNSTEGLDIDDAQVAVADCEIRGQTHNGIFVEGASRLTVDRCVIKDGGRRGIYIKRALSAVIQDTVICTNRNHGLRTESSSSSDVLEVRRCALYLNGRDGVHVHGASNMIFENCVLVYNSSDGIAIHSGSGDAIINHCTCAYNGNDGFQYDAFFDCQVTNSIFAFNTGDGIDNDGSNFSHSYNLSYGNGRQWRGCWPTVGCVSGDPRFVSGSDFHLNAGSAAIDAGTGSMDETLDQSPRPLGSAVDMGCYEGLGGGSGNSTGGVDYYVRITGNDSRSGWTPGMAFRTISKAISVAEPGDAIWVGAGTYTEALNLNALSGTSGKPISFRADVDGAKTSDAGPVVLNGGFYLAASQLINIDQFTIQVTGARPAWATASAGVYLQSSSDVLVSNVAVAGGTYGIAGWGTTASRVLNSTVTGATTHGIAFFSGSAVTIQSTTATGNTAAGFHATASDFQLVNCSTVNNGSRGYQMLTAEGSLANCSSSNDGLAAELRGLSGDRSSLDVTNFFIDGSQSGALILESCTVDAYGGANPICTSGTAAVTASAADVTLRTATITGTQYGIQASSTSNIAIQNCTISQCSDDGIQFDGGTATISGSTITDCVTAVRGENNGTLTATGCTFTGTTEWAVEHSGFGALTGCTVNNCYRGLNLVGAADRGDITLASVTVQGTTREGLSLTRCTGTVSDGPGRLSSGGDYGVYLLDSNVSFSDIEIDGPEYGLLASSSTLSVLDSSITACVNDGLFATASTATVTNCTIADCRYGIRSEANGTLTAGQLTLEGNSSWGIHHTGYGSVADCLVRDNQQGMYLAGAAAMGDVTITNTVVEGCSGEGLSASRCTGDLRGGVAAFSSGGTFGIYLSESDLDIADVQITGANFGVMAYSSSIQLSGATITDCPSDGFYGSNAVAELSGCAIARCRSGINSQGTGTLVCNSTVISDCTAWGLAHSGHGTITASEIKDCQQGLYLAGVSQPTDIQVSSTKVEGITLEGLVAIYSSGEIVPGTSPLSQGGSYGVYLSQSQFQLAGFAIEGSQRGVVAMNSTLQLTGTTIANTVESGLYAEGSTLTLTNNQVTACGTRGIDCRADSVVAINACTVQNCGDWGLAVAGSGTITACDLVNNAAGANLTGKTVRGDLQFSDLQISGTTGSGLMAVRCIGSVQGGPDPLSQGGDAGIDSDDSQLTVSNAVIQGAIAGVRSHLSDLTLHDVQVSNVANGFESEADENLALERVRITGCSGWGLRQVQGQSQIKNCLAVNLANGLYYEEPVQAQLWNATVVCAGGYGLLQTDGVVDVRNTILTGNNLGVGMQSTGGTLTTANNLVYGFATNFAGVTPDSQTVTRNPQFVNPAAGDYTLASGSPAINAGIDLLSDVTTDIAGNPRPTKNRWEIGAYESLLEGASFRVLEWSEKK